MLPIYGLWVSFHAIKIHAWLLNVYVESRENINILQTHPLSRGGVEVIGSGIWEETPKKSGIYEGGPPSPWVHMVWISQAHGQWNWDCKMYYSIEINKVEGGTF